MNNTAVNTLNYTGIVTLSQYIGSKKVQIAQTHNTGSASLFNFLATCLAGDFTIAKLNLPTKIKLLCREEVYGEYVYSPITSFIFLRTPPEPSFNAGESRVRFSFIIPRDFLESINQVASSGSVLGLGLYANSVPDVESETSNFMAFCVLDELDRSMFINTFLVVDWELIIANTPSSDAN